LTSDRFVLRLTSSEDVDLLLELDGDPEVMRYLTGGKPSTRSEVIDTIERTLGCRWVMHTSAGEFLGWVGLEPAGDHVLDIGWRLRRAAWGKGYATEAARELLRLAFVERGAHRVIAQTMAVNARSRAVMERLGMTHVRTFHLEWDDPIPGTEEGEVEYAITADEWFRATNTS
jgi:RimJ/RimL family protein N-acetyltransferase